MNRRLEILLSGVYCGEVLQAQDGNLTINYSPSYSQDATPISLSMPVGFLSYPKAIAMPFLQGLLPDNASALSAMAKRFGANPNNPFSLLQVVGTEVAGALEFVAEKRSFQVGSEGSRQLSTETLEQMLLEKLNEYEDGTQGEITPPNLSLAGAQPKLVLHKSKAGSWLSPSGTLLSTHILKPVPTRWRNLDIVEHQTMVAAKKLGLNVASSEIATIGQTPVFITERYDRTFDQEGRQIRVHQEDFCQSLSVAPSKKYQRDDGGPGVGEISRLIRESIRAEDQKAVAQAFFRGLVFNVLARCTDAHAKNYSVLLEKKKVSLAPLYDLSSTVLYGMPMKSAMRINEKYRFDEIQLRDLVFEASRLQLDEVWAQEVVQSMDSSLLEAFSEAGAEIREHSSHPNTVQTTTNLVEALSRLRSS